VTPLPFNHTAIQNAINQFNKPKDEMMGALNIVKKCMFGLN
jgi:hypothetical protein